MISLPPPRVLWPKMLKACSKTDLDLLRCELLIQMANEGFRATGDPNQESVEFLRWLQLEAQQRRRMPAGSRKAETKSQAIRQRRVQAGMRG